MNMDTRERGPGFVITIRGYDGYDGKMSANRAAGCGAVGPAGRLQPT